MKLCPVIVLYLFNIVTKPNYSCLLPSNSLSIDNASAIVHFSTSFIDSQVGSPSVRRILEVLTMFAYFDTNLQCKLLAQQYYLLLATSVCTRRETHFTVFEGT